MYFAFLKIRRRFNITNIVRHSPDDFSLTRNSIVSIFLLNRSLVLPGLPCYQFAHTHAHTHTHIYIYIYTYNQDMVIRFAIDKRVMLITRSWIRHVTQGLKLPNQERIKTLGVKFTITWECWKRIYQMNEKTMIYSRYSINNGMSPL